MDLSIVIPAYNEAARLPQTLDTISTYLAIQTWTSEIIVVDDGSSDQTAELVRNHPSRPRLIQHDRNRGKGAAVRTGMLAARGDWRLLTDADLSTPIEELERLWAERQRAEVIIGSRRAAGARVEKRQVWWKVWLGQLGNLVIQGLLVPGIKDTQCGFKLFSARCQRLFELQRLNHFGYDFELLFLARRFGYPIIELPVRWINDAQSKVRGRDYFRTLLEIVQIHLNNIRGLYTG